MKIGSDPDNLDGLNFLTGKRLSEINHTAELGVSLAHADGGVPNLRIEIPRIDARSLGTLIYFFEKACGISGYLLGVNPFDQPGVEAYKKNMFASPATKRRPKNYAGNCNPLGCCDRRTQEDPTFRPNKTGVKIFVIFTPVFCKTTTIQSKVHCRKPPPTQDIFLE